MGPGVRPELRVNQLGYLPAGPKHAVWVSEATEPTGFVVRDHRDAVVLRGRTRPWPERPDPSSGLAVHALDLSDLRAEGGFTIETAGTSSHPFAVAADLYRGLARDALQFFSLQRSGVAIDEARAPGYGRPAGHLGDASVEAWRGRTRRGSIRAGRAPGASTSPAAGTTRATTAGRGP